MTWVLFDYGGVLCHYQPESDVARLARAAGCAVPDLEAAYWSYRLDYDRAEFDVTGYWQRVAADLGRRFTDEQIAELSRLDTESWLHLQDASVDLVQCARPGWAPAGAAVQRARRRGPGGTAAAPGRLLRAPDVQLLPQVGQA